MGTDVAVVVALLCVFGQVFGGRLPAELPVVWNPRLTATAGQVVDDGSKNHLKSSRAERIPVRLELSSKVCRQAHVPSSSTFSAEFGLAMLQ